MTYLSEDEIKQVITKKQKHVTASKKSYEDRLLKRKKEILENVSISDTNNNDTNDQMTYVKEPFTTLFSGPTNCRKTKKALDLLENEYRYHFSSIIIICVTLRWNRTYLSRPWIRSDDRIFLIEPKDKIFKWIAFLFKLFAGQVTLFVVDDIISDETLDKKRQPLLELAISGRHRDHSLWLLTQSYTAIPKNLRRQKKMLFIWFPNEKLDLKTIDEETNIIDDLEDVNQKLKSSKHACLYIRLEHPREYKVLTG